MDAAAAPAALQFSVFIYRWFSWSVVQTHIWLAAPCTILRACECKCACEWYQCVQVYVYNRSSSSSSSSSNNKQKFLLRGGDRRNTRKKDIFIFTFFFLMCALCVPYFSPSHAGCKSFGKHGESRAAAEIIISILFLATTTRFIFVSARFYNLICNLISMSTTLV